MLIEFGFTGILLDGFVCSWRGRSSSAGSPSSFGTYSNWGKTTSNFPEISWQWKWQGLRASISGKIAIGRYWAELCGSTRGQWYHCARSHSRCPQSVHTRGSQCGWVSMPGGVAGQGCHREDFVQQWETMGDYETAGQGLNPSDGTHEVLSAAQTGSTWSEFGTIRR